VLPPATHLVLRLGLDPLELGQEAEAHEDPGGIGRGLDAGADLTELGRALEDGDAQALLAHGESGGESAEATADDDDLEGLAHGHGGPPGATGSRWFGVGGVAKGAGQDSRSAPSATTVVWSSVTVQSRIAMSRWA